MPGSNEVKSAKEAFDTNAELNKVFSLDPKHPLPGVRFLRAGFGTVDIRTLSPDQLIRWKQQGKELPYFMEKAPEVPTKYTPATKP